MAENKQLKKTMQHLQATAIARKQKQYRTALPKHGIIPFLITLERFEKEERYKECQLIKDTIIRANMAIKPPCVPYNKTNLKSIIGNVSKEYKKKFMSQYQNQANQCYDYLLNPVNKDQHTRIEDKTSNHFYFINGRKINPPSKL